MSHQGNLVGLLYLENNLTTGAFTPAHLEVLQLLTSQAAIAIANAQLYDEVARSEHKYRTLFEESRDAIFVTDPSGKIIDVNHAVLELFGYTKAETAQMHMQAVYLNAEDHATLTQVLLQTGAVKDFEVPLRKKDGTRMDCLVTATVQHDLDGHVAAYQGIIRDITARKQAERVLADYSRSLEQQVKERTTALAEAMHDAQLARHAAEAANRAKSDFLASMSHELRTPLNAILGFSEVLLEQMFGALNAKQEEYLNDIFTSGQHLLALINDILDLAKVEAGKLELELAAVDLGPLFEGCLILVRERALAHAITLSLEVAPDVGTIIADERKIKQIVVNLLANAVKFTPDHGQVGLRACRTPAGVEITVWDTGVGIAPDDQQRIFEAFQQVGSGLTRQTEGTGLGLALTKSLVELHGGTIRVDSRLGHGSAFLVTLPAVAAPNHGNQASFGA